MRVAVAIVTDASRVLVVQRRGEDRAKISWQFPAGMVKPGIAPETIVVRETFAETGVHCSVVRSLGSRLHPITNVHCDYFLYDYLTGEAENRDLAENIAVTWATLDSLTRFIQSNTSSRPSWKPWRYYLSQKTPDSAQPPIAAAVIAHHGKVLLVKRRVAEGSLSWQFPAGAVENGESAAEAAVREAQEEPVSPSRHRSYSANGSIRLPAEQ